VPVLARRLRVAQLFEEAAPEDAPDEAGDDADEEGDEAGEEGATEGDAAGDVVDVPSELGTDAELAEGEPLLHPATKAATRPTPTKNAPASIVCRICLAEVIHRSSLHIRPRGWETTEMPLPPQGDTTT
jgi:hypothetical protein